MNSSKGPYIEEFSTFRNFLSCSSVQDIEYEYRCEYVRNTAECQDKAYFFNYIEIMYCTLEPSSDAELYGCLVLFMCLVIVMFFILGATADKFFCPSLEMLSKVMGLSEHLAGVTLLAFGNGSPDLFTSLAGIDDPTTTMYSNILSAAIFVTAFVSGVICIIRPFHISASNLLRDTTFFILGTLYIDYVVESDNYVTRLEAFCIIFIYIIYLVVILLEQFLLKRRVNKMEKLMLKGTMSVVEFKNYTSLRQEASIDILARGSRATINIDATRESFYGYDVSRNKNLFGQLLQALNPIDSEEWSKGGWFKRTMICLKAPMIFLLTLFIPIVDYEQERHGWCKLLNCMQVVILPFTTFLIIFEFKTWLGVPICCHTLIFTIPLAILAFNSTRTDKAPNFHVGIGFLSAYGSIFVIYSCASETVEVLYVLGLVMNCSNSFLGCTLLAWGNGIGDLISNAALALHGYQKMAFAACYGGPFFNTLLCLGLVLLIKTMRSETGQVHIPGGPLGENCFIFMTILLFCTLLWSMTTNFYVRRSVGVFSILMYTLFFLYTILGELEVIQTYAEVSEYGFDDF
ncbi:mitochondrial sodium/calcium exchanger protein-like [Calliphora vicina]|uniref:mitochondrial sodium/calcium exchanger protein-like n=1 Tax=Calliphora vicina TaxID=7373 RepID=UPI00325B6F3D